MPKRKKVSIKKTKNWQNRLFIVVALVLTVGLGIWSLSRSLFAPVDINLVGTGKPAVSDIRKEVPPGCYYKQVQCIQEPCNPMLICDTPTPSQVPSPIGEVCTQEVGSCTGLDGACVGYSDGCQKSRLCNPKQPAGRGACESTNTRIPPNCTSWFDGCNTCMVKDGVLTGCTKMACKSDTRDQAMPKCVAYTEELTIPTPTPPAPSPSVVASPKPSEAGVLAIFYADAPCGELHYQSYTYTCSNGLKYSDRSTCVNLTQAMESARTKCRTGL